MYRLDRWVIRSELLKLELCLLTPLLSPMRSPSEKQFPISNVNR